ncbi:MAG: hypothetical protein DMG92_05630 [Acidobacteria bacterium]|nr:MAG: hypothetical protein DMG92_05630 [Acidobacteriota bacterium]
MFLALIASIPLHLAAAGAALPAAANTAPNSSWQQVSPYDSPNYDSQAERDLLEKANSDRARAGLPLLRMDAGLVRAARAHAAEMAAQKHISHQFSGEPSPSDRIAALSSLHLERTGENVAVAPNVDDAHEALMASRPHRDNLLSPKFNVAGFGVFRQGHMLYVAQDFGLSMAIYSVQQAKELVSTSVEKLRAQAKMPQLKRINDSDLQSSACAMAKADSLSAATPPAGAYMLRYSSMKPESLPSEISKVIARRGLHTYSAGTCYARTQRYPNGAYWVVLVFY